MSSPILFSDTSLCCGCGACSSICPRNAIDMKKNEDGNFYPFIDNESCIGCQACIKVCNYQNSKPSQSVKDTFAAVARDERVRRESSSGGVFAVIAKNIIEKHGVVYGCAYIKDASCVGVEHIRIENEDDISKIQGTKYVKSETKTIFRKVQKDLVEGRVVLFAGTPCQVDGLNGFLHNKTYKNLFTIDVLCHGAPDRGLFQDYIKNCEKEKDAEVVKLKFRDKELGWGAKGSIYFYKHGRIIRKLFTPHNSSYYRLFLDAVFFRENCYSCKYASVNRVGDISIGDFWGIAREYPEIASKWNQNNGISCILMNNKQGKMLLEKYGMNIILEQTDLSRVVKHNAILSHPCNDNPDRLVVRKIYRESGYVGIEKWWRKKQGLKRYLFLIKDSLMHNKKRFSKDC